MPRAKEPTLTIAQVAARLGLSKRTVTRYCEEGTLMRVWLTARTPTSARRTPVQDAYEIAVASVAAYEARLAEKNARERGEILAVSRRQLAHA